MAIAVFPLLIAVVGLLMWFISSNPKVSECGKILFFVGMLALALAESTKSVHIG